MKINFPSSIALVPFLELQATQLWRYKRPPALLEAHLDWIRRLGGALPQQEVECRSLSTFGRTPNTRDAFRLSPAFGCSVAKRGFHTSRWILKSELIELIKDSERISIWLSYSINTSQSKHQARKSVWYNMSFLKVARKNLSIHRQVYFWLKEVSKVLHNSFENVAYRTNLYRLFHHNCNIEKV